ncbi:MAG TPA: glycine oxidase ThiO [Planctomycetota bacterium]|nr:glycine oxidase ThiO [Planctomycetota bacterium]
MVLGGGIIGLSIARRLAGDGWSVTILERAEPGREASWAAAGMLAPHLEFDPRSPLFAPALRSNALYPAFAREIEEETGLGIDLRLDGVLSPIEEARMAESLPDGARRVTGADLRTFEPALGHHVEAALYFPEDGSVDNRALVTALLASAKMRGVCIKSRSNAEEVLAPDGAVLGVRARSEAEGDHVIECEVAVNCAGAWAAEPRVPGVETRMRPVKGQMLLLELPRSGPPGPRFTIHSHEAYVVPRTNGRVIVGTTVEDRGFDKTVEAGAVRALLDGAIRLVPSLATARLADAWAGLRPLGAGVLPSLGPVGPAGYYLAVGHYRNGILLAPLTALVLSEMIAGREASF